MWSFELPIINLREWLVFVFFYMWKLRLMNLIFAWGHTLGTEPFEPLFFRVTI